MEKIYIRGGEPLEGAVTVGGSKNDTVAIMAGALLVPGKTILRNVPRIRDVHTLLEIFRCLGASSRFVEEDVLEIDASRLTTSEAPHELVRQMRASFNVLGVLLSRFGHASVAMPGGCDIGSRPVNFHVRGLEQLGCHLTLEHGVYRGEVDQIRGANISLDFPSAGATQHLMITACRGKGKTVIENCAAEPEIVDLAEFLNACGAKITGAGTSVVMIDGVEELYSTDYAVIPDRLQAGTYAVAAAVTAGNVLIRDAVADHCSPVFAKLREVGADVDVSSEGTRVSRRSSRGMVATNLKTMPHPGFPTDMQQPFAALLSAAQGVSMITETVYESRFRYTTELAKMGADIRVEGRTAVIWGKEQLTGAPVTCTDLRGGAAVVIAGLGAEGETEIDGLEHLDRGYEGIVTKLRSLGACISRENDNGGAGGCVCSV